MKRYWLSGFKRVSWILVGLALLATALGVGGCGSDRSEPVILSGVFVDGPVAGLWYSTATLSGFTDVDGAFEYRDGEIVTFAAGEIVLGSAEGSPVLTPIDLGHGAWSTANMTAVNIARFLQLLDVDGNHSNGIEITDAMQALLSWDEADGANDGSIFEDETSIFLSSGTFAAFVNRILGTFDAASVFTASTPRTLALRTATGARRNLDATLTQMNPHPFEPYVKEVGIGVTDLEVSKAFYGEVIGLNYHSFREGTGRSETVYEDNRATTPTSSPNKLVLMRFIDDNIDCRNHPVKLVFAVSDADAVYEAILANGGYAFSRPTQQPGLGKIGMALDPDGYLIELIEYPLPGGAYLTAVGIGVADLETIDDFYTRVLGMRLKYYLHVPGFMNEVIMQSRLSPSYEASLGMDVVLMDYFNPRNYDDVPAKITFTVTDPAAVTEAIRSEALPIIREPLTGVRAVVKDPNGYEVELVAPDA